MTISHQTVLDEKGTPTAALIPWEEFQVIKAELEMAEDAPFSPEWNAELSRRMEEFRNGTAKLIPHNEVMARVRKMNRTEPPIETDS